MKKYIIILFAICSILLSSCGTPTKENSTNNSQPVTTQASTLPESADESNSVNVEFLPLEVKEYGYGVVEKGYLYFAVILHNPNPDYCIEYPSFRITARDADGLVLGSEDQTLSVIYPQQDFCYAGQAFQVEDIPATVDIEVLPPNDYQISKPQLLEHSSYTPLTIINSVVRDNRMMGEISNTNDFNIDLAIIAVVYRDESGKIMGGDSTFIDTVSASGNTPFDFSIHKDLVYSSYEVHANIW